MIWYSLVSKEPGREEEKPGNYVPVSDWEQNDFLEILL